MRGISAFIGALLLLGAIFFIYLALSSLDNSITVAAGAAMGSALLVGVVLLAVSQGFADLKGRQDRTNDLLEQQNEYLAYLAGRTRQRREAASPAANQER